jgi:glyoxylase-like metal-dependent hydrolase (beta-lactamase superfamily II)
MRVLKLENSGNVYTCNVYLVLGSLSQLDDVNTLVDVGQDPAILTSIERAPTGIGKWPVEQVVLTHDHSDHSALLPQVCEAFHPKVFAFSPNVHGVNRVLSDGDAIRMGDRDFEVIHMPGHSSDSICLYNQVEGVLFVGDSPVLSASATGTYEAEFLAALEKPCAPGVRRIYFGHGAPVMERCNEKLRESHRMAGGGPLGDRKSIDRESSAGDGVVVTT